ncbi:MAG: hypothetical protein IJH91_04040 [Mogibacterium sp.]|nr:hypothetical protein [Mogibacterium sp.]
MTIKLFELPEHRSLRDILSNCNSDVDLVLNDQRVRVRETSYFSELLDNVRPTANGLKFWFADESDALVVLKALQ